ncbi:ABC transporter permease [Microvirga lotononidis]|uniref:ABC-type multidrug transport system, permease component n=1 Tax=Microvirga lotononidis TaxID=864069 RepID=I4YQK3_9HYPH|nr:ABC transporter permease [Microvirga lotononidis]EIM26245.1 ABC-type multidrug transport system, permease component [Microvirga lotononidis]WQO30625.1 ABC transporter permease [Microvirga lotononidis]
MSVGAAIPRHTQGLQASMERIYAAFIKELLQLRRDRITFATMIFIPLFQLFLFGYAINTDPKHLPTAVLIQDESSFARSFLAAMQVSEYFDIQASAASEEELDHLILSGRVQFGVQIPAHFGRDLIRGERPAVLVIADASDPVAAGGAVSALQGLSSSVFSRELTGSVANLAPKPLPYELRIHRRYNPAGETRLNIVPGLMGTILTLTMLIFTALSVTREVERGTMESLLAMPIRPVEIMLGKIGPYLAIGSMQAGLILGAAKILFGVPIIGSLPVLVALTLLFILANLSVGYTFSTIATSQLQAMQMSFFFFLPNMLLSGFMFPFRGMPVWAQTIGEILPLTHYLRIVRGVMLKGAGFMDLQVDVLALAAFTLAAMIIAVLRFRQTLD